MVDLIGMALSCTPAEAMKWALQYAVMHLLPNVPRFIDPDRAWGALAMREAGASRIDAFSLAGLERSDGRPGKDLNDLLP